MLQLSTERENKASPSKIGGSPAKRLGQSEPTGAKVYFYFYWTAYP